MNEMQWTKLLDQSRLARDGYAPQPNRPIYLQDADRITFSAPFRRLANKTQVHPLYDHDHIHHRLIHSVETSSVGRSLGMLVGHWLEEKQLIDTEEKHAISGVVQAACLAHDIGNPPFGHSGESAIGGWFSRGFSKQVGLFGEMDSGRRDEFIEFEGNAQGFRLLSNLEMYRQEGGMQLSHAVLGAFTKYPVTALAKNNISESYCGLKKYGIFESEEKRWREIALATGLIGEKSGEFYWWRRHPLVFLVEAADDICYNILDLEDAFICGDLTFDRVVELLEKICGRPNKDQSSFSKEETVSYYRAKSIGLAISACVDAFKANYHDIMRGNFSDSLIEVSELKKQFGAIKDVAKDRIFTARRKTELEVSGRNVIFRVLDGILPIYEGLRQTEWRRDDLSIYDKQLIRALQLDLRDVNDAYSAFHSLSDFVSGMTDRYAVKVAKMVSGTQYP